MIHHVSGILCEKTPVMAVVEAMGIGFEIRIPLSTYEVLPEVGKPCKMLCSLQISQDDVKLYGFGSASERELFIMLLSVSGIGPKIALSVLSSMPIPNFVKAIQRGDEIIIAKVPGLGKKTALRLIMELKDSIVKLLDHIDNVDYTIGDKGSDEIESALVSLGFNIKEIRRELSLLTEEQWSSAPEMIIKETIKRLYQKR